jgi:hypothetical protein
LPEITEKDIDALALTGLPEDLRAAWNKASSSIIEEARESIFTAGLNTQDF